MKSTKMKVPTTKELNFVKSTFIVYHPKTKILVRLLKMESNPGIWGKQKLYRLLKDFKKKDDNITG